MKATARVIPFPTAPRRTGPARVTELGEDPSRVRARIGGSDHDVVARLAVFGAWRPAVGDEVLITGNDEGEHWVIGVLEAAAAPVLEAPGGGSARLGLEDGAIEVRDPKGTVLFSYRSEDGVGRLHLEAGEVDLESTGDVRIRAAGQLDLDGEKVNIQGRSLAIQVESAELDAGRSALRGQEARVELNRLRLFARRIENTVETVIEQAHNVYRRVRGLSQTHAGRVRTIADETLQVRARRVVHRAIDSYKVKSHKIHLG